MNSRTYFLLAVISLTTLFISPSKANAGVVVVNGLSHIEEVVPGGVYRGIIELQNTAKGTQAVKFYQKDYRFNSAGETFYNPPGDHARSNAEWIDFSPAYLTLKASEKASVSYEIHVPANESLYGTYWSVIMVEGMSPLEDTTINKGISINTQVRYAVQISTSIGKTGTKNLLFSQAGLRREEGKQFLTVDIENPADCLLVPQVSVELFDREGKSAGVFYSEKKKLYPGTSVRFWLPMEGVAPGSYQALLLADCSDETVFGVNVKVAIGP